MPKGRGLYGQSEGNEHNPNSFGEHLADNDTVEGTELAVARRHAKEKNFAGLAAYIDRLRKAGWSQSRTDSLLARAMSGVRITG